ncbi:hypothetical protein KDA11_05585 [Candidatus Saccharibacteria bacterium]|nr:hypothetical protein [Candidatus Saccharibacteria bacterium]
MSIIRGAEINRKVGKEVCDANARYYFGDCSSPVKVDPEVYGDAIRMLDSSDLTPPKASFKNEFAAQKFLKCFPLEKLNENTIRAGIRHVKNTTRTNNILWLIKRHNTLSFMTPLIWRKMCTRPLTIEDIEYLEDKFGGNYDFYVALYRKDRPLLYKWLTITNGTKALSEALNVIIHNFDIPKEEIAAYCTKMINYPFVENIDIVYQSIIKDYPEMASVFGKHLFNAQNPAHDILCDFPHLAQYWNVNRSGYIPESTALVLLNHHLAYEPYYEDKIEATFLVARQSILEGRCSFHVYKRILRGAFSEDECTRIWNRIVESVLPLCEIIDDEVNPIIQRMAYADYSDEMHLMMFGSEVINEILADRPKESKTTQELLIEAVTIKDVAGIAKYAQQLSDELAGTNSEPC